jgi:predicted nucleic acid-binding protein
VRLNETFVDTSAIYALIDASDTHHVPAKNSFEELVGRTDGVAVTHNYVVAESAALVQARLGHTHLRHLSDLVDFITVYFVDQTLHRTAWQVFVGSGRRDVSFVDSVSFSFMRDQHIDEAFVFDRHFTEQGFNVLPAR